MEHVNLSKSTLIRSLQCSKSLYLYKNYFKLRDPVSPEQQAVFQRGHSFGKLAHDLFPGGKDVSPPGPRFYRKSLLATEHLIGQAYPVIYEAAFKADDVLVFLDILVREEEGWKAYEVKSSRSISETYIRDAAIQNYVIRTSGLDIKDFFLVHVRPDYDPEEHRTAGDIFVFRSVFSEVTDLKDFVRESINEARNTLLAGQIPDIEMGEHCDNPYPCDFKGFCSRQESADI